MSTLVEVRRRGRETLCKHLMRVFSGVRDLLPPRVEAVLDNLPAQFYLVPAAVKHHHAYTGGLAQHVGEMLDLAGLLYAGPHTKHCQDRFAREAAAVVILLHDVEKIERYVHPDYYRTTETDATLREIAWEGIAMEFPETGWKYRTKPDTDDLLIVGEFAGKAGITLTDDERNALTFCHGGWSHTPGQQGALASFLHALDMISSQCIGK